jgi:uncharacterized membrane protein
LAGLAGAFGPWELAPLLGWDTAALTYVAWMWSTVWRLDAERTARQAVAEDPGRAATDVLLLTASVASLVAVGLVIVRAGNSGGAAESLQAGLSLASVVLSWSVVHTVFRLRYASLYYSGTDGGVDFNQDDPPRYTDFAYLAFTIGMTFQVSDTELTTTEVRGTALRHALLSTCSAQSSWPPRSISSLDWPSRHRWVRGLSRLACARRGVSHPRQTRSSSQAIHSAQAQSTLM